jgi:hypothetical protein
MKASNLVCYTVYHGARVCINGVKIVYFSEPIIGVKKNQLKPIIILGFQKLISKLVCILLFA